MALPKPQLNGDVLAYDENQTDGINDLETTVTDHNSKIMQLLNWMGLVKDYVIESDSNADGSWEKWNSGKLVQKVNATISVPVNVSELQGYRSGEITINYPISSLTVPKTYGLTCNSLSYSSLERVYNDRLIVFFTAFRNTRVVSYVSFESIGTWK